MGVEAKRHKTKWRKTKTGCTYKVWLPLQCTTTLFLSCTPSPSFCVYQTEWSCFTSVVVVLFPFLVRCYLFSLCLCVVCTVPSAWNSVCPLYRQQCMSTCVVFHVVSYMLIKKQRISHFSSTRFCVLKKEMVAYRQQIVL